MEASPQRQTTSSSATMSTGESHKTDILKSRSFFVKRYVAKATWILSQGADDNGDDGDDEDDNGDDEDDDGDDEDEDNDDDKP